MTVKDFPMHWNDWLTTHDYFYSEIGWVTTKRIVIATNNVISRNRPIFTRSVTKGLKQREWNLGASFWLPFQTSSVPALPSDLAPLLSSSFIVDHAAIQSDFLVRQFSFAYPFFFSFLPCFVLFCFFSADRLGFLLAWISHHLLLRIPPHQNWNFWHLLTLRLTLLLRNPCPDYRCKYWFRTCISG